MGAEIGWIKSGQAASLLQDQVDRLWGQRGRANGAIFPHFWEDWSRCNLSELHPLKKRQRRRASGEDKGSLSCRSALCPSEPMRTQGTVADAGSAGRSLIGSAMLIWECRRLATSLRRRPPAANASRRMARSRRSIAFVPAQVAKSRLRTSRVTGLRLLRCGLRPDAFMARRRAFLIPGSSKGGSTPFHWCKVDQLASRRDTVLGA